MSGIINIWIDAQLSPSLALWINQTFDGVKAQSLRALGLRDAADKEVFNRARMEKVVVMSKDDDFVELLERFGPPPQLIWITCGNTSNAKMRHILERNMPTILRMLDRGDDLVEIGGE